ncbi:MAG: AAA family ATPase, partial [Paeniclostridium sp.]|nr:AAA family ATPase [Paeniclostridium sp.]
VTSNTDVIEISNLPKSVLSHITLFTDEYNHSLDVLMNNYEENIICKSYQKHPSSYKLAKVLNISQSRANRLIQKHIHKETK